MTEARREGARIGAAALLLGASVLLSRVLGYVREALLAWRIGPGAEADAFYAAFTIPDLLNYLLAGGALSLAFIPRYARVREKEGEEAAARLLATVAGTLGAAAVLATIVLWVAAEHLVELQFPRFAPETKALCVRLTRIVLPAQIFFIVGGLVQGALMARDRFVAAAWAPVVYNGAIIAGGLLLAPSLGVEGFSWGALVGAAAGPLLAPVLDARRRMRLRLRIAPRDRAFLGYLALAAPLMLGQSLLTVDEWYERWFGALVAEGTVSHLAFARRLVLVPVAVVGQAVGAAALPSLARLHAAGRSDELGRVMSNALRASLAFALLAAAGFGVFAEPIVTLVYRRGAFGPHDVDAVSAILQVACLSVPFWVLQQLGVRAFYARGDTWRPMALSTVICFAVIPLYLALAQRAGAVGLAAAGVAGITINALATLGLARRRHGAPSLRGLAASGGRGLVVALLASGAGWLAATALPASSAAGSHAAALRALVIGGAAFAIVALVGVQLLGDALLRDATTRLVGRVTRRRARRA